MKRIPYLLLIALLSLLSSCGSSNGDDLYTRFNIVKEIEPQSAVIDWGNMTSEQRQKYPRKGFAINSAEDFPDEPNINMTDLKLLDVDFSKYTLLVNYALIPGYIKSHRLYWYYDNTEGTYVFQSNFSIIYPKEDDDAEYEMFTYYRSAALVDKIKPNKKVAFATSY